MSITISDVVISVVVYGVVYCTIGYIQLLCRLFLMRKKLETILADHKDFNDDFKKGVFSGLLCFYTEFFDGKKFLKSLKKEKDNLK